MPTSIRRTTLTDQVSDAILALVEERQLRDGDPLPSVGELATLFGVSLPVVREAVAGLSAMGVLQRHQGREALVSSPGSIHLERLLRHRIQNTDVSDTDIQAFREIVEIGNARLAGANATPENVEALDKALVALRAARTDEELHNADVHFHAEVANATGNDLLILTLGALAPLLRRHRTRVWRGWVQGGGTLEPIIDAHAAILERIRARDPEGAAEAMRRHLSQPRTGLQVRLPEEEADPEAATA